MPEKLQTILGRFDKNRGSVIPLLQDVQENYGYIPENSVDGIARHLDMSQTEIYGIATFYTQFRFTRPGDNIVKVCFGTACHVRGASQILDRVERHLGITQGETTTDGKFSLESVACIGCCALSPCITVNDEVAGNLTPNKAAAKLKACDKEKK